MLKLDNLNPKIYLSGAIVIGFFGIIDGVLGLFGYSGSIAQAFSLVEICWFLTSMVFLLAFKKQNFQLLIPALYMLYTLYGWLVGSYLLSIKQPGQGIILPVWYMISATLFGLFYCYMSTRAYTQWYFKK